MAFKIIDLVVIEEYLLAIEIVKTTDSGEFSGDSTIRPFRKLKIVKLIFVCFTQTLANLQP